MKILGLPKFERLGNGVKANSQHTIIKVKQKETGAIFQASVLNTSFDDQIGEQLKIISKCDDPCIIKSIGYSPTDFEGDEKTSIIYEFYSTQTLQNFIESNKKNSAWNDTTKLITIFGIASGIFYLHSKDCIISDLNPSSILINDSFYPKIADFQNLQEFKKDDQNTIDISKITNPFYHAPEVLKSGIVSYSSDIYSFGKIVYSILTNKIYTKDAKCNSIPPNYKIMVEQCLSTEPEDRPEIAQIIEYLLTDRQLISGKVDKKEFLKYIKFVNNDYYTVQQNFSNLDIIDLSKYNFSKRLSENFNIIIEKETNIPYGVFSNFWYFSQLANDSNSFQFYHPDIVKYIGFSQFDFDGKLKIGIITEKFEYNNILNNIMSKEKPKINETKKLIQVYQAASVLSYIHSQKFIYASYGFDVICLDEFLNIKFIYFPGLLPNDITKKEFNNSPVFCSPENFEEGEISLEKYQAADVFGFSILMYLIICEKQPYPNTKNPFLICKRVKKGHRPSINKSVPSCYQKLMERCWSQNPEDRPTFDQILNELKTNSKFMKNVNKDEFINAVRLLDLEVKNKQLEKELESKQKEIHHLRKKMKKKGINASKTDNDDEISLNDVNISSKESFDSIPKIEPKRKEDEDDNYQIQPLDSNDVDKLRRVKILGKGATAEVILVARDEFLAMKVFNDEVCKDDTQKADEKEESVPNYFEKMKRFMKEYETMNHLKHRNILKTFGFFLGDGQRPPCILLEYCPNNLKEMITRLTDIDLCCIIYEISDAMNYMHKAGFIHRDLKPENILLDANKHVKVSDFGISTLISLDTQTSYTKGIGTFKFMAPELLAEKDDYNEKVDVYAFGVVVYFILTRGQLPNMNLFDIMHQKIPNIPTIVNEFSKELILKCWSFSANERPSFQDIVEMIVNNNFKLINGIEHDLPYLHEHLSI